MNMALSYCQVETRELQEALGVSRQAVYQRAEREGWRYRNEKNARAWELESLPPPVQAQIAKTRQPHVAQNAWSSDSLIASSEAGRETAKWRAAFLAALANSQLPAYEFVEAYRTDRAYESLRAKLGAVSKATAYRWLTEAKSAGPAGLLPKYGDRSGSRTLSEHQQGLLIAWYCDRNAPTMRHCWNLLRAEYPEETPSESAVARFLNSLPPGYVDQMRMGTHRHAARYMPYIDRDPELFAPMQQVLSDHHCWDFLVEHQGEIFRPWITVFQDFRSAKILGWTPSVYPSSLTIAAAYYQVVTTYGAAELIHIDNGKDYRSKVVNGNTQKMRVYNEAGILEEQLVEIQGLFGLCGSRVTFAHAYHGQSKGRIERMFGTLAEYVAKSFPTYVGSNTVARHEDTQLFYRNIFGMKKKPVLINWDEYVQVMHAAVAYYNQSWEHTGKGMYKRTPDVVFASSQSVGRPVDKQVLALAFSTPEVRTVGRIGIELGGVPYWDEALLEYQGLQVVARRQLHDPETVLVCNSKGELICKARANWFLETGNLALDIERVENARAKMKKQIATFQGRAAPTKPSQTYVGRALAAAPARPLLAPDTESTLTDLPIAVGAEHLANRPTKFNLVNPLDVGLED